jgi:PAS domain S-box-containing protein
MNPSALSLPVDLLSTWLPRAVDAHAIVAVTDAQGVIIYANDAFTAVSGYTREELIGKTHALLKSGVHGPEFYGTLWSTIRSGKIWHGTFCNRAKDGHHYWVDSTLFPVPGPDGSPAFYLSLRTDVSALKTSEAAATALSERLASQASQLQVSQDQLAVFFNHAPIGISWREVDREGRPGANHVNRRFCELIGISTTEALDIENVRRATHPEDWAQQEALTAEIYAGKRDRFSMEKRYVHRDGRVVWGNLTVVVLRAPSGHVTHHFAMLEDVTARRAAEDELRRSEARWRTYLMTASEILYALTPEFRYKFVSPAWTTKLGHPSEDIIGRSIFEFVHPDDSSHLPRLHRRRARGHAEHRHGRVPHAAPGRSLDLARHHRLGLQGPRQPAGVLRRGARHQPAAHRPGRAAGRPGAPRGDGADRRPLAVGRRALAGRGGELAGGVCLPERAPVRLHAGGPAVPACPLFWISLTPWTASASWPRSPCTPRAGTGSTTRSTGSSAGTVRCAGSTTTRSCGTTRTGTSPTTRG